MKMLKFLQVYNLEVRIYPNESFEKLLKRFKKKVYKDGILEEVKERMFFTKKSDLKRLKKKKARYYQQKKKSK